MKATAVSRLPETDRIRQEYARRAREIPADFYSLTKPANLFQWQQRCRQALRLFDKSGVLPLKGKRVLEVGCGEVGWLADFEAWGVRRQDLAAIDLDAPRVEIARRRFCACRDASGTLISEGADIRCGDASSLPWPDAAFDVVVQSTMFTSILDRRVQRAVAAELIRVLKPGGVVLWFDFFVNNPRNPNVKGVTRRDIHALFSGSDIVLSRATLAPPLARRIVGVSWELAVGLEAIRILNTHYLGLIRKR